MSSLIKYLIVRCLSGDSEDLSCLAQLRFWSVISHPSCQQEINQQQKGRKGSTRSWEEQRWLCWAGAAGTNRGEVEEEWGRSEMLKPKAELLGRGVEEGEKGGKEKGNAVSWMETTGNR